MGRTIWFFLFDGDTVARISQAKYRRVIFEGKPMPEKAGETLKTLQVYVELEQRNPVSVVGFLGEYCELDEKGFHNRQHKDDAFAILIDQQIGQVFGRKPAKGNVIDMRPKRAP